MPDGHLLLIRQDNPEDGDRHQARFRPDQVGNEKRRDHDRQQGGILKIVRDPIPLEQLDCQQRHHGTDGRPRGHEDDKRTQCAQNGVGRRAAADGHEDDDCQNRADRVVDGFLPT